MPPLTLNELIPVLQVAIGPVILVSGVGLLLLSMTNRLARVTDRARLLSQELRSAPTAGEERLQRQLSIFAERAELIRRAIYLASISVLLAAVLVIVLFFTALFQLHAAWLVALLFIACMLSLIGSLVAFIRDIDRSLHALKLELGED